eukprot:gene17950-18824_t
MADPRLQLVAARAPVRRIVAANGALDVALAAAGVATGGAAVPAVLADGPPDGRVVAWNYLIEAAWLVAEGRPAHACAGGVRRGASAARAVLVLWCVTA